MSIKKNLIFIAPFIVLFNFNCSGVFANIAKFDSLHVAAYESSQDYKNNKLVTDIIVVTDDYDSTYVKATRILDKKTGKVKKNSNMYWALLINDELYINFSYVKGFGIKKMYIKFEITGRYCVAVANDKFPLKFDTAYYYYPSAGIVAFEIFKKYYKIKDPINLWTSNDGKKHQILYCDTHSYDTRLIEENLNGSCYIRLVTQLNIESIFNSKRKKKYKLDKTFTCEKIVEIFKELNSNP